MVKVTSRYKYNGFTLIELMIATSLLMLVMFSGYYAYSLYTNKWQNRTQRFWLHTNQTMALSLAVKAINSSANYIVQCKDSKPCIYFRGNTSELEFVTHSPIFSTHDALVKLSIEQGNEEKNKRLIYRERDISKNILISTTDVNNSVVFWDHEVVLISDIESFEFSFFGWKNFNIATNYLLEEFHTSESASQQWYSNHNLDLMRILPEKIEINMSSNLKKSAFEIPVSSNTASYLLSYMYTSDESNE